MDRLLRSMARLEKRTQSLLRELGKWSPEQLQFRPAPEAWSALQLVDHLIRVERTVLAAMRSHLSETHAIKANDRVQSAVLLVVMALPIRVKAPGPVAAAIRPVPTQPDLGSLRGTWASDRRLLTEFLRGLSAADRKKGLLRHPAGGWTSASGALLFVHLHLRHHRYQFARLRKAFKTQKTARAKAV
jgi:DinB superfamily